MTDTTHRAYFGDGEHDFAITPELILELERTTGSGIGALFQRLCAGTFHHTDMAEVVRLGLIGGGEAPERAASLVAAYATHRPISESYPLALSILEALWFGKSKEVKDDGQA